MAKEDQRKLAEVELDSAGLRQLVRLKSKELTHMKRLASIILQKRNEVETFLLDSIELVKAEIARRRAEERARRLACAASSSFAPCSASLASCARSSSSS